MLGEFRRDLSRQRHAVITANPELRERELAKLADYADAVAKALRDRGVDHLQSSLAADAGMTVFRVAMEQWSSGRDDRELADVMEDSLAGLREVAGES
jgi:MftR C-terminal domain